MPNIKVKGQAGNVLTFENVERVLFDSADDNESTVPFSYGDVIEISPITLALGDGDQTVTAPEGTMFRTAVIKQPETLKPENIRRNVDIGGVVGTLIGDTEEATVELNFPASTVETDIFPEQTVTSFYLNPTFGKYFASVSPTPFMFVTGKKYTVVWDGEEYEVEAIDASAINGGATLIAVGNGEDYGIPGNNEPFIIATSNTSIMFIVVDETDSSASHTVRIYQKVSGGGSDQVVLPSEEGKVLSKVTILKPEGLVPENIRAGVEIGGVTGDFSVETEEATVALSMADGDQVIEPTAEGKYLTKVTVNKPETLIPENIAKGVNIAGIVGTLSKSEGVKIASGKFTGTQAVQTIEHGLGVVPDIVVIFAPSMTSNSSGANKMTGGYSMSAALYALLGCPFASARYKMISASYVFRVDRETPGTSVCLDNATADGFIHGATETTFKTPYNMYVTSGYTWVAIAGLV